MTSRLIFIDRIDNWRADIWDDDVASRTGWVVTCAIHGRITPDGWTYETDRIAQQVATRHLNAHHRGGA